MSKLLQSHEKRECKTQHENYGNDSKR